MGLVTEITLLSGILLFAVFCLRSDIRKQLGCIIGLAVLVRVIALILTIVLLDNPVDSGFAFMDDRNYHDVGARMVELWNTGTSIEPADIRYQAEKNVGYYYVNASLYWLFGPTRYVGSVFNIFAASLVIILVYFVGEYMWSRQVGARAALIVACLPDMAIWSTLQFKDTIVGCLVLWCILNLQRIVLNEQRWSTNAQALTGLLLLFTFRAEASFLLILAYAAAYLTTHVSVSSIRIISVIGGVITITVVGLLVSDSLDQRLFVGAPVLEQLRSGASLEIAMLFATSLSNYSQSAIDSAGVSSLGFMFGPPDLWRLPIALLFVVLIPFPPWPRGVSIAPDMITVASIPWLLLMPMVLIAITSAWRRLYDRSKVLLYYLSVDWVLLAIFLFAFNPQRHRIASLPLMVLLASAHWPKKRDLVWWIWTLTIVAMAISMPMYLVLQ